MPLNSSRWRLGISEDGRTGVDGDVFDVDVTADVIRLEFEQLRDHETSYMEAGHGFIFLRNPGRKYDAMVGRLQSTDEALVRLESRSGDSMFTAYVSRAELVEGLARSEVFLRLRDLLGRASDTVLWMYARASLPQSSGEIFEDLLDYSFHGVSGEMGMVAGAQRALPRHSRNYGGEGYSYSTGSLVREVPSAYLPSGGGRALVPSHFSPYLYGVDLRTALNELQDEESGDAFIFCDAGGWLKFEGRATRAAAPASPTRIISFDRWRRRKGRELREHEFVVEYQPDWTAHGHRTMFVVGDVPFQLQAGESRTYHMWPGNPADHSGWGTDQRYRDVHHGGVLTPVAGTDYHAWQNRNGTGRNLNSSLKVTIPVVGGPVFMRCENTGSAPLWVTRLAARTNNANLLGGVITESSEPVVTFDSLSLKRHVVVREMRWARERAVIASIIADRRRAYGSDRDAVTVDVGELESGATGAFGVGIGDAVDLDEGAGGEDLGVGWVDGQHLEYRDGGQLRRRLQVRLR